MRAYTNLGYGLYNSGPNICCDKACVAGRNQPITGVIHNAANGNFKPNLNNSACRMNDRIALIVRFDQQCLNLLEWARTIDWTEYCLIIPSLRRYFATALARSV
ncbi:hypothetical protein BCF46_2372 [Litoreibacter meonggei]|uniref:Uncharacterized protein n=1 Tax=Litoreibacter meonggei TaxID=1049199 RepID=A0A497WSC5_9RHOB|nr:hypothetical protein BCF46_2372 [Litoreibacter meonggei]